MLRHVIVASDQAAVGDPESAPLDPQVELVSLLLCDNLNAQLSKLLSPELPLLDSSEDL